VTVRWFASVGVRLIDPPGTGRSTAPAHSIGPPDQPVHSNWRFQPLKSGPYGRMKRARRPHSLQWGFAPGCRRQTSIEPGPVKNARQEPQQRPDFPFSRTHLVPNSEWAGSEREHIVIGDCGCGQRSDLTGGLRLGMAWTRHGLKKMSYPSGTVR
jgi:hypothetical protein